MKKRQKTTEKKHPTNSDVQRLEQDIRQLLNEDKDDSQIRQILKIELRTYQRYMKRIHKQNRELRLGITKDELASELLRLRASLSYTYRYCMDKLNDPNIPSAELLEWLHEKDNARMNLVKILTDYPREVDQTNHIEMEEPEPEPEEPIPQTKEMKQSEKNIQKMLKVKHKVK